MIVTSVYSVSSLLNPKMFERCDGMFCGSDDELAEMHPWAACHCWLAEFGSTLYITVLVWMADEQFWAKTSTKRKVEECICTKYWKCDGVHKKTSAKASFVVFTNTYPKCVSPHYVLIYAPPLSQSNTLTTKWRINTHCSFFIIHQTKKIKTGSDNSAKIYVSTGIFYFLNINDMLLQGSATTAPPPRTDVTRAGSSWSGRHDWQTTTVQNKPGHNLHRRLLVSGG